MKIFIQTILLILAISGLQAEEPIGKVFSHDKNSGKVEVILTSKKASQLRKFYIQLPKKRVTCLLTGSYHTKLVCKLQGKDALTGGELVFTNQIKTSSVISESSKPENQPKQVVLGDGVKYLVLKKGAGPRAETGAKLKVHYTGWLAAPNFQLGDKFDSSVDREQPFVFPLGAGLVISGWESGCKRMQIGEKRRIFIPAHRGYGARGAGDKIPPNADLIFDIELLEIE